MDSGYYCIPLCNVHTAHSRAIQIIKLQNLKSNQAALGQSTFFCMYPSGLRCGVYTLQFYMHIVALLFNTLVHVIPFRSHLHFLWHIFVCTTKLWKYYYARSPCTGRTNGVAGTTATALKFKFHIFCWSCMLVMALCYRLSLQSCDANVSIQPNVGIHKSVQTGCGSARTQAIRMYIVFTSISLY